MNNYIILVICALLLASVSFGQESNYTEIEYTVIAEGSDSPFENYQIVCFNKYFNLEQLPAEFRDKYDLADRQLFKKKMLLQLFYTDIDKQGLDKFVIEEIKESPSDIAFYYSLINSDTTNDGTVQSPFIIVQIPKNTKKQVRFIANGKELGKGHGLYIKD